MKTRNEMLIFGKSLYFKFASAVHAKYKVKWLILFSLVFAIAYIHIIHTIYPLSIPSTNPECVYFCHVIGRFPRKHLGGYMRNLNEDGLNLYALKLLSPFLTLFPPLPLVKYIFEVDL